MFRVEAASGTILAELQDEQDAVLEARIRLEDDPEMGELYVASEEEYLWRATFVPDFDLNSVVAVIPFDAKLVQGGHLAIDQHTDLLDAYADNWAKIMGLRKGGAI